MILKGLKKYEYKNRKYKKYISVLTTSIALDCGVTTALADLMNSSNENQFSLTQFGGSNFKIKEADPQKSALKEKNVRLFDKFGYEGTVMILTTRFFFILVSKKLWKKAVQKQRSNKNNL